MKKVLIVGGGVAGLTAGIYAQLAGLDSEIFERSSIAGGNLTGWDRNGYHIDNCIHWLTGTDPRTELYTLWRETGALDDEVPIIQQEQFYTSRLGDEQISLFVDPERTRAQMIRLSPRDLPRINAWIDGVQSLIHRRPAAVAANVPRYFGMNLAQLGETFEHPLLQRVFTDYFGGQFSVLALMSAYSVFCSKNGGLPAGGSRQMAERMQARYLSLGGVLHTDMAVHSIPICQERAQGLLLQGGAFMPADAVICACDPHITFSRLLPLTHLPYRLRQYYEDPAAHPVFSAYQAAFAVSAPTVPFSGTTVFGTAPFCIHQQLRTRLLVREFSHEPDFSPPGNALLQAMVFLDAQQSDRWQALRWDTGRYQAEKERIARDILFRIEDCCPDLRGSLMLLDAWTPATYQRRLGAYHGAFLPFAMTGLSDRVPVSCQVPGLTNLFLASQWQRSPGGLPTAARMGKAAAGLAARLLQQKSR